MAGSRRFCDSSRGAVGHMKAAAQVLQKPPVSLPFFPKEGGEGGWINKKRGNCTDKRESELWDAME